MSYRRTSKIDNFDDFEEESLLEEEGIDENNLEQDQDLDNIDSLEDANDDLGMGRNDYYDDGFDDFGGMGGGISPIEKHSDLLKDLTNFSPFIRDKVNGWLGIIWNDEEGKFTKNPLAEPIMNAKCAFWCIDFLKIYARGNNIITNISKEEYKNLVLDIIDVVWYNLATRADLDFGIKNNGDILKIAVELQHTAELVLMGAGSGKYNEFLGTITTRSEHVNPGNPYQMQQHPIKRMSRWQKVKGMLIGN